LLKSDLSSIVENLCSIPGLPDRVEIQHLINLLGASKEQFSRSVTVTKPLDQTLTLLNSNLVDLGSEAGLAEAIARLRYELQTYFYKQENQNAAAACKKLQISRHTFYKNKRDHELKVSNRL